jgi:hypothetical protein
MSGAIQTTDLSESDIVDRIAKGLPENLRADFYREMRHCRELPQNDEMLRILRMMQFLTVLIEQVPERIVTERERIEAMIAEIAAYHRALERRLTALPSAVAEGMSPDRVAASINESLRQQFERSTLPQTAGALSALAADIKRVTTELDRTATKMWQTAATVSDAARSSERAVTDLSRVIRQDYKWSVVNVAWWVMIAALIVGVTLGWWASSSLHHAGR